MAASLNLRGGRKSALSAYAKSADIAQKNAIILNVACMNKSASALYCQLLDSADAGSSNGGIIEFEVAANSTGAISFDAGLQFTRGLFVRAVTAMGGTTLIAADDAKFLVHFEIGPVSA